MRDELDVFVEERRREDNLPGVGLAAVRRGRMEISGAWGVPPGSAFQIGSRTKLVTAVIALRLRERGLVDLDEPVRRRIPIEIAPEITLRHLLAHRSGLPRGPYLMSPVPLEERLAELARRRGPQPLADILPIVLARLQAIQSEPRDEDPR